jgi:HEAT repeat protein
LPIPEALIDTLKHSDHNARSEAVLTLDRLDEAGKLPLLIGALRTEPDVFVREDITAALMHIGAEAVAPLVELLQDPDSGIRHHAAHALGKIGDAAATSALVDILRDEDVVVVAKTIFALDQIRDVNAVLPLAGLLGHENLEVQAALSHALEHFGSFALPPLADALSDSRWEVRERAAEILGSIGDPAAATALIGVLEDEAWQVRFAAVSALGELETPAVESVLRERKAQGDSDPRVRAMLANVVK